MTAAQRKIDVETDAMLLLRHMVTYDYRWDHTVKEWVYSFGGVKWTIAALDEIFKGDERRARNSIRWLCTRELAYRRKREYIATQAGAQLYHDALCDGRYVTSEALRKFIFESLTGMKPTGKQSRMNTAVLPNRIGVPLDRDSEERFKTFLALDEVAKQFEISKDLAMEYLSIGKIHECKNGEPHLGMFTPDRGSYYRRGKCDVCRKRERK